MGKRTRAVVWLVALAGLAGGIEAIAFAAPAPRPSVVAPRLPFSRTRMCRAHSDCVLLPGRTPDDQCDCPRCGVVWRRAVNQKRYRELKLRWMAIGPCAPNRPCPRCRTLYRGLVAHCISGECRAFEPQPKPLRSFAELRGGEVYALTIVRRPAGWTARDRIQMPYHHATRIEWVDLASFGRLAQAKVGATARVLVELVTRSIAKVPHRRQWRSIVRLRILRDRGSTKR
ncbi:MAG: hypothetical protein KC609_24815 [Myxococcales bacterium]|nr:hypothetical protein [Myxococcales bacterium]